MRISNIEIIIYMKKVLLLLLTASVIAVNAQTPIPPKGKKWVPVRELTDEFNGDKLDGSKWDDYHPHWEGRAPSKFLKGNAFVEDGYLKLRSTLMKDPSTVEDKFKDMWVNSAACVSKQRTAKPGYYYEARIKASSLSMTSSFWFRVGQYSEIDIIEHVGNPSVEKRQEDLPYEFGTNTHYYGPEKGPKPKGTKWHMPTRGRDEFHVYGMWWKPDGKELVFYHNGEEINRLVPRVPLQEDLKMVFDTEVFPFATAGVAHIGLPLVENLNDNTKNTMLVDWVRTYKLVKGKDPRKPKDAFKPYLRNGTYAIASPDKKNVILAREPEKFNAVMVPKGDWNDQRWDLQHVSNNTYLIKNHGNGRFLQVDSANCESSLITSDKFSGETNQQWKIVKMDKEYLIFPLDCRRETLEWKVGKLPKVDLATTKPGSKNQKWTFIEAN